MKHRMKWLRMPQPKAFCQKSQTSASFSWMKEPSQYTLKAMATPPATGTHFDGKPTLDCALQTFFRKLEISFQILQRVKHPHAGLVCKVIKQVPQLPRVFHHVWNQNGNVAYRKFLVSSILWAGEPPPAANPARIVLRHSCSDQSAVREVHVSREIGTWPLSIGYLMHHQLVVSSPLKKCVYV